MTLDELLPKLFPDGNDVKRGPEGTIFGMGKVGLRQSLCWES